MLSNAFGENFQSFEELLYTIESGVSNIDGWNEDDMTPEGSGKSAILNLISWTAYGKLPKDTNIDDIIKFGKKSCKGILQFDDGASIYRGRKPDELYLEMPDGTRIKGKDKNETQALIVEYLGIDFETFCQCVYFAQDYNNRFLPSNQESKGKILSSILNLKIFDKGAKEADKLAKIEDAKYKENQQSLSLIVNNINNALSKIKMIKQFVDDKKKIHENQLNTLKIKLQTNQNLVVTAQREFEEICVNIESNQNEEGPVSIEELDNSKNELKQELMQLDAQKRQLDAHNNTINSKNLETNRLGGRYATLESKKQKLIDFINNPNSTCPTCNSPLAACDTSHAQKELQEIEDEVLQIAQSLQEISDFLQNNEVVTLADIQKKTTQINEQIRQLDSSRQAIKNRQDSFNSLVRSKDIKESNIQSLTKQCEQVETEIRMLKPADVSKDETDILALETQLVKDQESQEAISGIVASCKASYDQYVSLKDAFKEIKTYIFVNTLNELNYRTNQYLSQLFEVSASLKFSTEDQMIETVITLDGETTSLGLLSGGQLKRFDLAVNLSMADIVNTRKASKFGFLSMDEYFKNLSEVSMEKCLNLLKTRKSPVILIEHNSLFKSIVDKTFFARLKNKTSVAEWL